MNIKAHSKCKYCLCDDPDKLTFHHRIKREKSFNIGGCDVPFERLMTEIAKCDILCSECHQTLHMQEDRLKFLEYFSERQEHGIICDVTQKHIDSIRNLVRDLPQHVSKSTCDSVSMVYL